MSLKGRAQKFWSLWTLPPFLLGTKPSAPPRVTEVPAEPSKKCLLLPPASPAGRRKLPSRLPLSFAPAAFQTNRGGKGVSPWLWNLILLPRPKPPAAFPGPSLGNFPVRDARGGRAAGIPPARKHLEVKKQHNLLSWIISSGQYSSSLLGLRCPYHILHPYEQKGPLGNRFLKVQEGEEVGPAFAAHVLKVRLAVSLSLLPQ